MKKVLLVKAGGFYSKDDKSYSFDDYTLVANGVKLNFESDEITYEILETTAGTLIRRELRENRKSEKAIRSLKITIDSVEEARLIPKHAPYDNESKEI